MLDRYRVVGCHNVGCRLIFKTRGKLSGRCPNCGTQVLFYSRSKICDTRTIFETPHQYEAEKCVNYLNSHKNILDNHKQLTIEELGLE